MIFMQTYSGRAFYFEKPEFHLEDIVASLSRLCRYTGHTRWVDHVYSVAQHSVLMANWAWYAEKDQRLAFECLMHDAPEAYTGDLSSPVKKMLGKAWQDFQWPIEKACAEHFGLVFPLDPRVREIDKRIWYDEKRDVLKPSKDLQWDFESLNGALNVAINPWSIEGSEKAFTLAYIRFGGTVQIDELNVEE